MCSACRSDQKLKKLAYLLTPEGLQHRLALTRGYLERKTSVAKKI